MSQANDSSKTRTPGAARRAAVQGPHQLGTRGVAGMEDARSAVGGLPAEGESVPVVAVEARAQGHEPPYRGRAFPGQEVHHVRVREAAGHRDRVRGVERGRVVGADGRRDSPLRPRARASGPEPGLGDDVDPPRGEGERRGQTGDARADDHDVGGKGVVRSGAHRTLAARTASIRSTAWRARRATSGSTSTSNFKSRSDS